MRRALPGVVALLATAPVTAAERWDHPASGASLPRRFEAQSIRQARDLGTPNDSVVDYEADAGVESTTIYVFRATVANARLWFDRALSTVAREIPMALFVAGPVERVAAFGSPTPNALRQVFSTTEDGPFKTTALVVAQSGSWIVKVRATSSTLDRVGLAGRIDRHLATMKIAPAPFAPMLDPPPRCGGSIRYGQGRSVTPDADALAGAAAQAVAALARVHGSGGGFCLADGGPADVTLLGDRDRDTSWLMLLGDAGKAIGSEPSDATSKSSRQYVYVASPAGVRAATLFDGPPSLADAVAAAVPLLRDPAAGLLGAGFSAKSE